MKRNGSGITGNSYFVAGVLLLKFLCAAAHAAAPSITKVEPFAGPPAGGTNITITGEYFTGATAVKFGGVAATSVSVVSDTQITCTTSAHSAGFVDVSVTTPEGTGTLANGFFYDGSTWASAGNLATARYQHTATLLASGKLLVAGGYSGVSLASAELYDPGTNTWSAAGNLATARYAHTSTLLPSGKVLVAGGYNGGAIASAELYDPGTNTWSAAGSLATARFDHTAATLLPSGKVLVSGGQGNGGVFFTSAELFDPATNTWSAAGSLTTARQDHTATLLPNGKVLVAGGWNGSVTIASAELYDPGTNTWNTAGSMSTARAWHTATLLSNGKVLLAGGGIPAIISSVELYDPGTNTWSATGSLATARGYHTATLLPSGKVLVAGGHNNGGSPLSSAEQYDPGTNTWITVASLATARYVYTATLLPNAKVLAVGGFDGSPLASAEIYDYTGAGSWSGAGSLAAARESHTATLLPSGEVLVTGGYDYSVFLNSAERYDPGTNTWNAAGTLATGRDGHTATLLPNGKILVAGGYGGSTLASAELYDSGTNTWSAVGSLATARTSHTATLLPSGKVLVAGGWDGSTFLASAELYDPGTNTWSAAGSLATGRGSHTATLLQSGKVLATGGYNGSSLTSAEIYDPGTNTWSAAGSLATAREMHTATLLPSGKVLVAAGSINGGSTAMASAELYDPGTNTWSAAGSLATARYEHTATLLTSGKVLAAGGYNSTNVTSAEIYDPGTNTWSVAGSLATGRYIHTATLLPNAKVLVVAGLNTSTPLASAELFAPGTLAFQDSWRPVVNTVTSPLATGGVLTVGGTGFKGISEASGGGYQSSATNYPLVQLRSLVNEQTAFLPCSSWSGTSFVSKPVNGFPQGHTLVTVFTNGIPSVSKTILLSGTVSKLAISSVNGGNSPTAGAAFSLVVESQDANGNPAAVSADTGVSLSVKTGAGPIGGTTTGTISAGTTSATISGITYSTAESGVVLTVTRTSGDALTAGDSAPFTVNPPAPAITSATTVSGTVGTAFSYNITASNTPTSYNATGLPAWASVNTGTGAITGTPDATGSTNVTISATNAGGTGQATLAITINPPAPVITSAATAGGTLGQAFSYQITASNNPTSYNATGLPSWASVNTGTGAITGTPDSVGRTDVTISATNAGGTGSATLTISVSPSGGPSKPAIAASPNPAKTGQAISFSTSATHPDNLPLTYTWNFDDGATAGGSAATHSYTQEKAAGYQVTVTVTDGYTSVASDAVTVTVYAPASGGGGANNGATATNPLDGVTITVLSSDGGVLDMQVTPSGSTPPPYTITTVITGISGTLATITGSRPVYKFVESGIYVVTATVTDAGGNVIGQTRITVPIGVDETGGTGETPTPPGSLAITGAALKGKFIFNVSKPDVVTFKGTIELPAGLEVARERLCWVGAGNVVDYATLDAKGKGKGKPPGVLGLMTKLQAKYPRLKKPATATSAGMKATIAFTLSMADMDQLGFNTEGITNTVLDTEKELKSVNRSIQVALVLAGTAYRGTVPVTFKLSKKADMGQLATRRQ